jgi:RNA polymerase sigma-70 factor (ECF subfamily)
MSAQVNPLRDRVMTDEDIIRRVKAGNRALFGVLHDRHYGGVFRFALRLTRNEETAKDIAADTFVRAYTAVDRYQIRPDVKYISFLLRVAWNLAVTHNKRRARSGLVEPGENGDLLECVADTTPGPEQEAMAKERAARVRRAIAALPARDQLILGLAYERQLSMREIGEVMGKPSVSAVTSHLYRAVRKLRTELEKDNLFAGYMEGETQWAKETTSN